MLDTGATPEDTSALQKEILTPRQDIFDNGL